MNIDGKVIVITGAARGIGQEYARYLGGLGARIVAADINDCSSTLDLVKAESGTAVGAKLDVASAASAMDVARAAVDAFGRIDALINNAALYGGLKGGRFDTISEPDWDAAMAVNVKGIWNCCKAVVPAIRRGRRRQHRQHRLAGGDLRHAVRLALHHLEGRRDRSHPRPRAGARPRQYPGECRGAERGLDRGHARILRRENRQGARYHQDEPGDSPETWSHRTWSAPCTGWCPTPAAWSPARPSPSTAERSCTERLRRSLVASRRVRAIDHPMPDRFDDREAPE